MNFVNKLVDTASFLINNLDNFVSGEVSELADEHDLGSCAERRGGSSPPFPTKGEDVTCGRGDEHNKKGGRK